MARTSGLIAPLLLIAACGGRIADNGRADGSTDAEWFDTAEGGAADSSLVEPSWTTSRLRPFHSSQAKPKQIYLGGPAA